MRASLQSSGGGHADFGHWQTAHRKWNVTTGLLWCEQGLRKGRVLVHCYAGQSRAPTLAIAYLIASTSAATYCRTCVHTICTGHGVSTISSVEFWTFMLMTT